MEIEEQDPEILVDIFAKVVGGFLENMEAIHVEWENFRYMVYRQEDTIHVVGVEDDEDFEDLTKFMLVEMH